MSMTNTTDCDFGSKNKMREIKFRLKSPINEIVGYEKWYPGCLDSKNFWQANPCWLYSTDSKFWNPSPIKHRFKDEYTGLKDKNGKEIYEGDIGKTNGWIVEVRWNGKLCYYYVEFSKAQFGSSYRKMLSECYLTIKPYTIDFEIIGNRFENPELLKENKNV